MRPELLPHAAAEALAAVPLSTRLRSVDGTTPPGHRRLVTSRLLTRRDFDAAADALLCWGMHAGAGLGVAASSIPVESSAVVQLTVGRPVIPGLTVACRVIDVFDEEWCRGFTYATLAGHLESGIQRFMVSSDVHGRIRASVVSISAPARGALRWAGPLPVWAQRFAASRYCASLDT